MPRDTEHYKEPAPRLHHQPDPGNSTSSHSERMVGYNRLKEEWTARFGSPPPKNLSRRLLVGALAYEAEADLQGGLSAKTKKMLRASASSEVLPDSASQLATGARLVREWNGSTYVLDVTGTGYKMGRREFKSLSAAAKAITGAHWNGRAFFGLVKRKHTPKAA